MAKHWLIRSEAAAFGWNDCEGDIIHPKRQDIILRYRHRIRAGEFQSVISFPWGEVVN